MRNSDNFRQAVGSPKSWNSMGYICLKTTFLHLKHYLQIYLTLLSTDLWFGKWHEEYGKFFPEHSKLRFWWDPLIETWKRMSLKSTQELSAMTLRKIWRGTDLSFQSWREEFWPKHLKASKNFLLMGSFWAKYILFELKKYRGVIFHETEEGYKIWKGIGLSFQNWHKEFDKLWPEQSKVSKVFTLMCSFWVKYKLFELKRYRGVIFHETE